MRKTISVLLIVLVGLMMFTACNPESSISDALVKVRLVDGNSRALSASLNFDVNKVKRWEYSAVKADNGLKTGETKDTDGKVITDVLDENKQTAALSQGAWNFYLYGYDAAENGNLICKGSALDVLITSESSTVSITVNPLQEETGVIAIDNNIVIVDKNGKAYDKGEGTDEYTKTITVTKFSDSTVVTEDTTQSTEGYTTYSVDSGTYKVVVTYTATHKGTTYTAATATKYVNVYDHLTTKVSGTITESEQAATINAEGSFEGTATVNATFATMTVDTQSVTANSEATTLTFDYTPVGKKGTEASGTDNLESTFVFPAGSLKKTSEDATVSIEYKTASAGTAAKTYEITDATGAVVAAVDITANGFDSTNLKGSNGSYPVLTTFIGKDLGTSFDKTDSDTSNDTVSLGIQYYGDFVESDADKAELLAYDSGTGYLKYSPKHFSTYVIFSNKYALTDDNGAMYETLADAVEKAADGATITLWKDVDITTAFIELSKNLTVDLNSRTIKVSTEVTSGAAGLFKLNSGANLTVRNGFITTDSTYGNFQAFRVPDNAERVTLDVSDVAITAPNGIVVRQGVSYVDITVRDSIINYSVYGIATNASAPSDKGNVNFTIRGTVIKLKSDDCNDSTGILLNVPTEVTIVDSAISGGRQGAILRGGTYTISGSAFEYKFNNEENKTKENVDWGSGNAVPNAAIVIGNRGTGAYKYSTTVTFEGTNKLTASENGNQLYVYQASTDYPVKVSGDINGDWTVNENINGAEYPLAKIENTYYSTLCSAVNAAKSGETVTLLCDASGSGLESKDASGDAIGARGDITIDFGGHTYTVTNTSVGSTGTETQAMHWGRSIKSITMKNGKLTTKQFGTLRMGMQNYVDFTAEKMTFDMSNVDVVKFGANEFSGNYAIYNGKEVAIFNNNKGDMKLTNCTVTLPESSEMGMSADGGSVTLTETTVNGAVNMQDSTSKLIKDSASKITKDVIAYFSDTYDVVETTADSSTTYSLKAKSST